MNITNSTLSLTPAQLSRAAELKAQIDAERSDLEARVTAFNAKVAELETIFPSSKPATGTRNFSDEARKRISDAQKARWAKINAAKASATPATPAV